MLEKQFDAIGAEVRVTREDPRPPVSQRWRPRSFQQGVMSSDVSVNVLEGKDGATFTVRAPESWDLQVLNVDPSDRHLVLLAKDGPDKRRFLCGHDERHYFVAAIPESTPVTTVRDAKQALMPDSVRGRRLKRKERGRRKTSEFVRQGEWFFVPVPDFDPGDAPIYRDEPIARTGGKPHLVQELCRLGGELVYISRQFAPNGITQAEYDRHPRKRDGRWSTMQRDAVAYARGTIRHSDHATIRLDGWHRIDMNTENRAAAMQSVAFLD